MFSVYMPNKRRESSGSVKGAAAYRQHKVTADVLQFPDLDASPDSWPAPGAIQLEVTWSEVSDEIQQGLLEKLRTVPGASGIRDVECDGVPGIELTIAKKDGPNPQTAKKRAFVVGNRAIVLAAYFYHVEKDGEHGVLFGEKPNRFLDSLHILPSPPKRQSPPPHSLDRDDVLADDDQPGQPNALPHWMLYHSESGGFEILLPEQKVESVGSRSTTRLGQKTQEFEISATSGISIAISWFDLPADVLRDKPPRTLLNQILREEFRATTSSASKRDLVIGDNPGAEYLLWERATAGGLGKARFFLVGRRVFALRADCIVDRIKRDAQVNGFLNSFRLYKKPGGTRDEYAVAIQERQSANLWPILSKQEGGAFVVSSSTVGIHAADGLCIQFVVAFGLEPPKDRGRLATLISIYADVDNAKLQRGVVVLSLDANGEEITLVSQDKVEKDPLGRRCVEYTLMDPYEIVDLLRDVKRMTIKVADDSPHQLDQREIAHIRAFMQEVRDRAKEFGFSLSKR